MLQSDIGSGCASYHSITSALSASPREPFNARAYSPNRGADSTIPYMRFCIFILALAALPTCASDKYQVTRPAVFTGMCDASAAVAVSSNLFIVANDEDNVLRLYDANRPGPALQEYDFNDFLEVHGKSLEADLEGAARMGDRAFWIGSHGRNWLGKDRANRCRLFATDIRGQGTQTQLSPVGRPYTTLLDDLAVDPRFLRFHLVEAAREAPKDEDALNIEGLSATPQGGLLIGFRNPIPEDKALLIPLLNPNDVIESKPAKFGNPILLKLGGLGIRDIAFHNGEFLIIAGPYNGKGPFRFFSWDGPGAKPERWKTGSLDDLHPEGLIIYPETGFKQVQVISDDGTRVMNGMPCKSLPDPTQRHFRSFWLSLKE